MATILRSPLLTRRVILPAAPHWDPPNLVISSLYDATQHRPFTEEANLLPRPAYPKAPAWQWSTPNLLTSTLFAATQHGPFLVDTLEPASPAAKAFAFDPPNLAFSTLGPVQNPFQTPQWDDNSPNRAAKSFDQQNLLTSTLFIGPFEPLWWDTVRFQYVAKHSEMPDLLTATLAQAAAQTPFMLEPAENPKAVSAVRQLDIPNLLTTTLFSPFANYDWAAVPRSKSTVIEPEAQNLNNTLLAGQVVANPFAFYDWASVQRIKASVIDREVQNLANTLLPTSRSTPFAQYDWASAQRAIFTVIEPEFQNPTETLLARPFVNELSQAWRIAKPAQHTQPLNLLTSTLAQAIGGRQLDAPISRTRRQAIDTLIERNVNLLNPPVVGTPYFGSTLSMALASTRVPQVPPYMSLNPMVPNPPPEPPPPDERRFQNDSRRYSARVKGRKTARRANKRG